MFRTRILGLYQMLQGFQVASILILYPLSVWTFYLTYHPNPNDFNTERYAIAGVIMVIVLVFFSLRDDLDRMQLLNPTFLVAHDNALRKAFVVLLVELLFIFSIKDSHEIARAFLFGWIPFLYLYLLLSHRYLPLILARISFSGDRENRTLFCGSRDDMVRLGGWLQMKDSIGLKSVGLLTNEAGPDAVGDVKVIGQIKDLDDVIKQHKVSLVIFLHIPEPKSRIAHYFKSCEKLGARFIMVNDFKDILGRTVVTTEDEGISFIGVRHEPLENSFNRLLKRLLDFFTSLFVVFILLPPLAMVISIVQLFTSRGPLFHNQVRAGLQNRKFIMFKFRTMDLHDEPESKQATKGDPRIYPFGAIMRKYSIDELPQFINVLIGEMSVVGPRPHMVEHNELFADVMDNYHIRSFVKPGITGLAQVRGLRGEAKESGDIKTRLRSDLEYIENWSLALDIMIIIRSGLIMFFPPKTAY